MAAVLIKILHGSAFETHLVYPLAGPESAIDDRSGQYIFQLGAHKSSALSRLNMQKLHNRHVLTINLQYHAVSEIRRASQKNLLNP